MPCFYNRFNSVRKRNPECNPNQASLTFPKTTSSAQFQIHVLIICRTNMRSLQCNFSGPRCWDWIKELSAAKLSRPVFVYIFCLPRLLFYYIQLPVYLVDFAFHLRTWWVVWVNDDPDIFNFRFFPEPVKSCWRGCSSLQVRLSVIEVYSCAWPVVALVRRFSARPRLKCSAAGATPIPDTLHRERSLTGYLESKWFGLWKHACHLSSRCSQWHTSEVCECLNQLVSALPCRKNEGCYFAKIYVSYVSFSPKQARSFTSTLPVRSHRTLQKPVT